MKFFKRKPSIEKSQLDLDCDLILHQIGGTGLWQALNFILLCLPTMASGFLVLSFVFTGFKPVKYRCAISECDEPGSSFTFESIHDTSSEQHSIFLKDTTIGNLNFCAARPLNSSMLHERGKCTLNDFDLAGDPVLCDAKETNVIFDELPMKSTIVTEFNLFCNEEYKAKFYLKHVCKGETCVNRQIAMVGSMYMVGMFFGGLMIGRICDVFGRRFGTSLSVLIGSISHFGAGWATNYYTYVSARFLSGIGGMGCLNASFTLVVEIVEAKHRRLASMGLMIAFSIGEAFVGVFATFIPEWRDYHFYTSIPLFLIISIYWLVAESPRWLNRKRKYKELYVLFKTMAKINMSEVPPELEEKLQTVLKDELETTFADVRVQDSGCLSNEKEIPEETENVKPIQLLLDPILRLYTIVMFFNWALVTLGYYGISMASVKIGWNAYVSQISAAVMGIPSYIFCILLMDRWGRKPICCFGSILCGIASIAAGFAEGNIQLVSTLIGKFGSTAVFGLLYLYTAELYPTEIRGTAIGLCCMLSRLGGIAAPQVSLSLTKEWAMFVLGLCSLIAGVLTLALPETLGTLLVERIEEVHELKEDGKPFFSCWSESTLEKHIERINTRKKEKPEVKQKLNLSSI